MPDIVLQNIYKSFSGQVVLGGINAKFSVGDTVAVTGPSGCGKTTLARIVMGLEATDSGEIIGAEHMRFSCVFQEERLCEGMSAIENIALVIAHPSRMEIVQNLEDLDIDAKDAQKPVRELSGGQRRRVALCRALLAPSDFLVLDEAFKGLDEAGVSNALNYTWKLLAGRTLLLISHGEEEAARCNSRIALPSVCKTD